MPTYLSVSLLLIQAVIAFLAYPNPLFYKPNLISALLLPLMGVPFFIVFLAYRGREVFLWTGISVAAMILLPTIHLTQMNFFPVVGVLVWLLVLGVSFLLGGACGYLGSFIYQRLPWSFTLAAPAIYCSQEFARVVAAEYFSLVPPPSLMLAFPFAGLPPVIQMSSYTGYYGPAFLAFFLSALLALLVMSLLGRLAWFQSRVPLAKDLACWAPGQRVPTLLVTGILAAGLFILFVLGNLDAARVSRLQDQAQRTLRPALLQSQFDPSRAMDWGAPQQGFALRTYRAMSLEAVAQGAQVLVFTENALPMTLPADERAWQDLRSIFQEIGLPAFVGLTTTVEEKKVFNIWYLVSDQGLVQEYYLKRYLTPFGEYLPLRRVVDPVVAGVNQTLRTSYQALKITAIPEDYYDLRSGQEEKVFGVAGATVGLKVCTETIIPRFFREAVALGAEVILSPRTVNWFKTPVDWYLNLEACAFRAVESRRWIGLVANMGAAATVDALGVLRSETPYGRRVVAVPTLPLLTGKSFYARFGDWFAGLCLLATLLLALAAGRQAWRARRA